MSVSVGDCEFDSLCVPVGHSISVRMIVCIYGMALLCEFGWCDSEKGLQYFCECGE